MERVSTTSVSTTSSLNNYSCWKMEGRVVEKYYVEMDESLRSNESKGPVRTSRLGTSRSESSKKCSSLLESVADDSSDSFNFIKSSDSEVST